MWGLLLLCSVANATIVVPLSLEDLTVRSRAVVRATVRQHQSAWDEDHKRIYSYTELSVTEVISGEAPETLLVRTLGGEVGDIGMKVSGTPRFVLDQEVVVFLRRDSMDPDDFTVVGMSQGLYRIERDSAGRVMAVPGAEGLAYARKGRDGQRIVDTNTEAIRIAYEALKSRVQAAAAAPIEPVVR